LLLNGELKTWLDNILGQCSPTVRGSGGDGRSCELFVEVVGNPRNSVAVYLEKQIQAGAGRYLLDGQRVEKRRDPVREVIGGDLKPLRDLEPRIGWRLPGSGQPGVGARYTESECPRSPRQSA